MADDIDIAIRIREEMQVGRLIYPDRIRALSGFGWDVDMRLLENGGHDALETIGNQCGVVLKQRCGGRTSVLHSRQTFFPVLTEFSNACAAANDIVAIGLMQASMHSLGGESSRYPIAFLMLNETVNQAPG